MQKRQNNIFSNSFFQKNIIKSFTIPSFASIVTSMKILLRV